jgi:folate-dependent phosphoribosylglycinamide formyltransferase PurN
MKLVIFTRTGFHHTSFINRLQERFEVACVVRESYPEKRKNDRLLASIVGPLFKGYGIYGVKNELFLRKFHKKYSAGFRHHGALHEYLKAAFGVVEERKGTHYLNVECGEVNTEEFASFIGAIGPDIIAVLGSSVIKPKIISIPSVAMINLHSGLSPYYRGVWSYGWPIVNDEPECIGATVHHVNAGIDTGDIIYQTRPRLDDSDDLNTIFLKVIAEGIELVCDAIEQIQRKGRVESCRQSWKGGRLYRASDLTAHAARRCLRNLKKGTIAEYNANKTVADSRLALFGYVPPKIFR